MMADTAAAEFRLVLVGLADGRTDGIPVGCYLASYDPEADGGNGMASWTSDRAQAMTFHAAEDAVACYRAIPRSRPARPDGKPNRPLTMFSVIFDPS